MPEDVDAILPEIRPPSRPLQPVLHFLSRQWPAVGDLPAGFAFLTDRETLLVGELARFISGLLGSGGPTFYAWWITGGRSKNQQLYWRTLAQAKDPDALKAVINGPLNLTYMQMETNAVTVEGWAASAKTLNLRTLASAGFTIMEVGQTNSGAIARAARAHAEAQGDPNRRSGGPQIK